MKVVVLTSGGDVASLTYNAIIKKGVNIDTIVQDIEFNKWLLIKKRIKKYGFFKVIGQLLFQTLVVKFLSYYYSGYIAELKKNYGINDSWKKNTVHVKGINSAESIKIISDLAPDLIVLAGTKILSKKFLSAISCPIINVHVGVTPKYRGVHGGYWALVNKDKNNLGVTVHYVDAGIDTGKIIKQSIVEISDKDSFVTYGLKQLKRGTDDLAEIVKDLVDKKDLKLTSLGSNSSKLYSHPTIWTYFKAYFLNGIK